MEWTLEDGKAAVRLARTVIEHHLTYKSLPKLDIPKTFQRKCGVFVTINTYPAHRLRGCIGYPEPLFDLTKALINAAKSAATQDPRFPPMHPDELDHVIIEVTLLTPPELIVVKEPEEYLSAVVIGRDGLIAEQTPFKGLLLPQVPVEWGWDVREFLAHTCMKAGLSPDAWRDPSTKMYRFSGRIFCEKEPNGEVIEKPLRE